MRELCNIVEGLLEEHHMLRFEPDHLRSVESLLYLVPAFVHDPAQSLSDFLPDLISLVKLLECLHFLTHLGGLHCRRIYALAPHALFQGRASSCISCLEFKFYLGLERAYQLVPALTALCRRLTLLIHL